MEKAIDALLDSEEKVVKVKVEQPTPTDSISRKPCLDDLKTNVPLIYKLHKGGRSIQEIADFYNMTYGPIRKIINGESYRDIKR